MKLQILAAAFMAATMMPAFAYTSYLKPDEFWPTDAEVTIEAAYASQFFTPQIALAPQFTVLSPAGQTEPLDRVAVTGASTTVETDLPRGGTYRISTGEQFGQVSTLIADQGAPGGWRPLPAGETPAPGIETTTLQTVTVADVYVTRGAPTRDVVDRPIGTLAIRPVTHPNEVLASGGLEIEVLFNGAPLANTAVVLYGAGDPDTKLDTFFVTGADGHTLIAVDGPGDYVIAARHRADAPMGEEADIRSYTTSLTFQALAAIPAFTEVREETRRDARQDAREPSRAQQPARRRVGRPDY